MGRTDTNNDGLADIADHPHARGENITVELIRAFINGPSPRTWGELGPDGPDYVFARTIPTHVGRTPDLESKHAHRADHPHARGENFVERSDPAVFGGPSPRTWGEHRSVAYRPAYFRTIPTHVGRTFLLRPSAWVATDHPHARGENWSRHSFGPSAPGPSPRTWGER